MTKKIEEVVATGRRKRAVASVRLRPGTGKVDVNKRPFEAYFPLKIQRDRILAPLKLIEQADKYDIVIRTNGGGVNGQVGAALLGITRALVKETETLRSDFKAEGFLTRDPRKKERKKYGRKKARKSFQFSKR